MTRFTAPEAICWAGDMGFTGVGGGAAGEESDGGAVASGEVLRTEARTASSIHSLKGYIEGDGRYSGNIPERTGATGCRIR